VGGVLCYYAIQLKDRFGYDDSLDVVGIHGVGGIIGGTMLGLFADSSVNESGTDGLFYGQPSFLLSQIIAMVSVIAFSIAVTYAIVRLLDATVGLRVEREDEYMGLDISQHSETVYATERRLRA
jgi:Amt family ammonium transporter